MDIQLPAKLSLAQCPTPLQRLSRLSSELGGPTIWVKRDDMTGSVLSGNKVRKLEYLLARATEEGADTLITCGGVQSNHCRATALAGAQQGFNVHLILRGFKKGESSEAEWDGNLLLDHLGGAQVSVYPPEDFSSKLTDRFRYWADCYRERGHKAFCIPTGGSNGIGLWGYLSATLELQEDFKKHQVQPQYIVCASGSGGTQAGLTLGSYLFDLPAKVMGFAVCDDCAYFKDKVKEDIGHWHQHFQASANSRSIASPITTKAKSVDLDRLDVLVNDKYIGAGYGIASEAIFNTIQWAARLEGLVLDPVYTGKAFYGLVQEIKAGAFKECSDVVFVHTGGVFGLFPQKQKLVEAMKGRNN